MVRMRNPDCYICGDQVKKRPITHCVICGKVVCPRCCFNRIHKRKTYYVCSRDKGKFDPETIEQLAIINRPSDRRITFPRRRR
jgi:hypothetical protein